MDWRERVALDPHILAGKPILKGTRIAVKSLLELLAEGWTSEQIIADYPQLSDEDIRAALSYATETFKGEKVYPLPA